MADLNYWAGDPFDEQLNQLKSALSINDALITLTGEAGVGKSALCQEFQAIAQANGDFVIYLANPPSTIKDLQQAFKSRQPQLDQYSFMTVLEQWLVERAQQGRKAVLIIDNAHQLNVEVCTTIRLISNLQTETRHLIQVLLCARPQMYKILGAAEYGGLLQRVSHRLELLPLNKTQLHQLVNDCYSVHLAPATLSLMYKLSQGKPGIAVNMAQMLGQQGSSGQGSTGQSSTGELSKRQFGRAISHNAQFSRLLKRHRLSQSILPTSVLTAALVSLFLYNYPVQPTIDPVIYTAKVQEQSKPVPDDLFVQDPAQVPVQQKTATALLPEVKVEAKEVIEEKVKEEVESQEKEAQPTTLIPPPKAQIEQAVAQWASAWQAQDVDGFFSAYTSQFTPNDKTSHPQWRKERMIRIIRPLWITVNIDDIQIMNTSDQRIFSQFWLSYAAPDYQDKTLKQLEWIQQDGRWVITTEHNIKLLRQ
ncbi:MAG: AAA family ATPase [Algicola sp.]|nr:AAA family ATPase [Algicola sp.]